MEEWKEMSLSGLLDELCQLNSKSIDHWSLQEFTDANEVDDKIEDLKQYICDRFDQFDHE